MLVVGGGLAGLELAKELENRGCDGVLVVEAGPVADLRHVNETHSEAVSTEKCFAPETDEHFHRPYVSGSAPHYTLNSGLRRRLGGRSLYWHGVVLPLEPWALAEPSWPAEVVADLVRSWRGGPSLYERVTAGLQAWQRSGTPKYAGAPAEVEIGGERLVRTPAACSAAGGGRWRAYSPLDHWLDAGPPAPGGVRFLCDTEVVAVDVRDGRATGVAVRQVGADRVHHLAADAVVLCAAAVENARLAIQALTGAGVLAEPRLGGLADHIVQGFVLRLTTRDRLPEYLRHPASYVAPARAQERSYLRVDVHHPEPGEVLVDVRVTGEQLGGPGSYVECRPEGEPPWPATVHTSMSAQDLDVVAGQRAMLQRFWTALARDTGAAGRPLEFEEFGEQTRTNTFVLPGSVRKLHHGEPATWVSLLGTEDHEGGTLPLGSALDTRHQLVGVAGLYAAGPTTFPRLGAANPTLTSLALAHRLAALLAG
ncbi:GMC family oxidoreductase [Amycolatopsis sp. H6(2020)]|nr:GMC family oxidoreductase [Amycolatopsis sp. H6(2020)]